MAVALIIYGIMMISLVTAVVLWGLKTGQFSGQRDARNLPLEVEDPGVEQE